MHARALALKPAHMPTHARACTRRLHHGGAQRRPHCGADRGAWAGAQCAALPAVDWGRAAGGAYAGAAGRRGAGNGGPGGVCDWGVRREASVPQNKLACNAGIGNRDPGIANTPPQLHKRAPWVFAQK